MRHLLLLLLTAAAASVTASGNAYAQERGENGSDGPRGFGGPIELQDDDKPAFPEPPEGIVEIRDGIPHGKLEMIEYESKAASPRHPTRRPRPISSPTRRP